MGNCGKSEKTYEMSHHLIDKEIAVEGTVYSIKVEKIIEETARFEK